MKPMNYPRVDEGGVFHYRDKVFFIVMDSVRHDQFLKAKTPNIDKGEFTNFSPAMTGAAWTIPSVMNFMTGRLPCHSGREQIFPFCYWLPKWFHEEGGFTTHYITAVGIPLHAIKYEWDTFYSFDSGPHDAKSLVDKALDIIENFPGPAKFFYIHFEDTHSPFECKDNDKTDWRMDKIHDYNRGLNPPEINEEYFEYLKKRQIECIEYMDKILKPLIDIESTMVITSDHGELFGEIHHFGHDMPWHPLLFKVPLLVRV